jgi:hypothetical protein
LGVILTKRILWVLPALLASAASLAACSTIIDGTTQKVTINTNPAGASCTVTREGTKIAVVNLTPSTITVDKDKHDITIVCDKAGYLQTSYLNHSGIAAATVGNAIAGGLVGWAVDSATGADNKYDSVVNITMAQAPATK